ncbi:MAG: GtrA family protein [Deefgea sp.]
MMQLSRDVFSFINTSTSSKAKFIRYVLIGGSAALLDFTIFILLFNFFSWIFFGSSSSIIFIANTVGILSGFVWGFFLQKIWAFQSKGRTHIQFFYTVLLLAFNILITSLAIVPLALLLNNHISLAKVTMQIVVVLWNYFIYNYFIFKDAGVVNER